MLHLSVSSLEDFMTCRRLYYWKRVKGYVRAQFSVPMFVGRIVHYGISYLFKHSSRLPSYISKVIDETDNYYCKELKHVRNTVTLTEKQDEDVTDNRFVIRGMLLAYAKRYAAMLKDIKLISSEVEGALQINNKVTFVIKLDNLLRIRGKNILHELKTSKYITPDYIRAIQTNRQTAIYYYVYNNIFEKNKIDEILFDVIRKPSIRQKKGEGKQQFLDRLMTWYEKPDDMACFHLERFKTPVISEEGIFRVITNVADEMIRAKHQDDYYENHTACTSYYGDVCPYYELCHKGGESKENMVLYEKRIPYHIHK